jgi:hypothetical protein
MIYEWRPNGPTGEIRNFGDALSEMILNLTKYEDAMRMKNSDTEMFFLIGSVIHNTVISETLELGYEPVFINCGWRGEALDPTLLAKCRFEGCRGPRTQQALAEHGIDVDITLDSAYHLLKRFPFSKNKSAAGEVLVMPHISDVGGVEASAVFSSKDTVNKMFKISQADFVLGGAMHACIVAHHYGVPFAPYLPPSGYVDCPPKWVDWLESIGVPEDRIVFCKTVEDGKIWYESVLG